MSETLEFILNQPDLTGFDAVRRSAFAAGIRWAMDAYHAEHLTELRIRQEADAIEGTVEPNGIGKGGTAIVKGWKA